MTFHLKRGDVRFATVPFIWLILRKIDRHLSCLKSVQSWRVLQKRPFLEKTQQILSIYKEDNEYLIHSWFDKTFYHGKQKRHSINGESLEITSQVPLIRKGKTIYIFENVIIFWGGNMFRLKNWAFVKKYKKTIFSHQRNSQSPPSKC